MEYELEDICHKGELTSTDLEHIYKIVDIIKDITTIEAMLKADKHKENDWDDTKTYSTRHETSTHV